MKQKQEKSILLTMASIMRIISLMTNLPPSHGNFAHSLLTNETESSYKIKNQLKAIQLQGSNMFTVHSWSANNNQEYAGEFKI